MKVLFIHQNCPGQFKHLAPAVAARPGNEVRFLTQPGKPEVPGVRKVEYRPRRRPTAATHRYLRLFEDGVLHGQAAAQVAVRLREEGFRPDVICAHMGWGEALYLKDVWPSAALLGYFEFYYRARGADVGFDPATPVTLDDSARIRSRNALHLLGLEAADRGLSPTRWQWLQHPPEFRPKIEVIHDGIDTVQVVPDAEAVLEVAPGVSLRAGDEVVTYVARNLEPYRGFPTFMRAVALLLERRQRAHVVVVGGDDVSYGSGPPGGRSWRETLLDEVRIDPARVHFLGRVPYPTFLRVLQVSAVHAYLTYPFVLSWSMLEAMAAGCLVVGSRTPPVEEVIRHGENGLLFDFFSPEELAGLLETALRDPPAFQPLRQRARATVLADYALENCLSRQLALLEDLGGNRRSAVAEGARGSASGRTPTRLAASRGPPSRRR